MLKKYLSHSLVRYILVGGCSYALELIILFSLYRLAGLSATTATAISFWVSIITSFFLQKIFSFKNYQKQVKMLSKQFTAYGILVLFNYCFTILVVAFFPDNLLLLSRTLALAIVTVWNYLFYRQLFSDRKADTERRLEILIESIGSKTVCAINKLLSISETKWFMAILTTASILVLLVASIYAGTQATRLQSVTSDQFIGTYNYSDAGTPTVDVSHTNILKAPVLWAQGHLSYTFFSLAAVNVGFIFLSFILWIYLLYRLLGIRVIALASLAFSAILINSTSFSINITMTTIRHIEYPIALLFIVGLSKLLRIDKGYLRIAAFLTFLLGVLILHDYFFLYTLVPAGLFTILLYGLYGKLDIKQISRAFAVLLAGTALSIVLAKLLTKLDFINIVSGYAEPKSFLPYEKLSEALHTTVQQTFNMFGAFIFGGHIDTSFLGILGCFGLFILCAVAIVLFVKFKKNMSFDVRFTYFFMLAFMFTVYLVYILVGLVSINNARYLTVIVYIGVSFLCWLILKYKHIRISYLASCIIFICVGLAGIKHNYSVYAIFDRNIALAEESLESISSNLAENNVRVVGTTGGYQSLRFYGNKKIDSIFEVMIDCNKPVPWVNNSKWINDGNQQKTAILIDGHGPNNTCTRKRADKVFGPPSKVISDNNSIYETDKPISLLIYNYDIRSRILKD